MKAADERPVVGQVPVGRPLVADQDGLDRDLRRMLLLHRRALAARARGRRTGVPLVVVRLR